MPTVIYKHENPKNLRIACLSEDSWELPKQLVRLEQWLLEEATDIPRASYVADVGYAPRDGALGGGGAVTRAAMEKMLAIGMELFLSEYPPLDQNQASVRLDDLN
jgi:hypothetical protein